MSHPTAPRSSPGCAPGDGRFPRDVRGGAGGGQRRSCASKLRLQENTASPSWFVLPNPERLSPRWIKPRWPAQAIPTNPTAWGAPGLLPGCRAHKVLVDLAKCWLQARLLMDPKTGDLMVSPSYGPASMLTHTPPPRTRKNSGIPVGELRTPKAERKGSSRVLLESATVGSSNPVLAKDRAAEGPTRLISWLASLSTRATQWDMLAKAALQHHWGFQPVSKRLI